MAASPLIVATDIRNMTDIMTQVLLNPAVIAVNRQTTAPGDVVAEIPGESGSADQRQQDRVQLWTREVVAKDGKTDLALAAVNFAGTARTVEIPLSMLEAAGWGGSTRVSAQDLWASTTTTATGSLKLTIQPHDTRLLQLRAAASVATPQAPAPAPAISDRRSSGRGAGVFNVTSFGAVGDGKTSNTKAFVAAVAAVAAAGGGTIVVPRGVWLTGPFNLTSHCTLFLQAGAKLLGSTDLEEWPLMPPMPSYGSGRDHPGPRHVSLIHGFHLTDVVITGENGTVDGNGEWWWARHKTPVEKFTRGHLIELMWCTDIEVSHLVLQNSPFWTVHPVYSRRFTAAWLTILNPHHSPNTDGIDPDSTSDVSAAM